MATTTGAGEAVATGEENGETGSDGVTTSNGFGDSKTFEHDKDFLVDCKSSTTNVVVGPGEPVPPRPPIEIEGCEGCFIDAVTSNQDFLVGLVTALNSPSGLPITIGNVHFAHSLFQLCRILDTFAFFEFQLDSALDRLINKQPSLPAPKARYQKQRLKP